MGFRRDDLGIIDTLHLVEVARAASLVAPHLMANDENVALEMVSQPSGVAETSENGKKTRCAR